MNPNPRPSNAAADAGLVIVGAGHGGDALAAALRQQGFEGRIRIIGDERHLPYQRPPLSKAFLKEDMPAAQLALRPEGFYEKQAIEVIRNTRVLRIDRQPGAIEFAGGERIAYGQLVLATGSRHRRLAVPGVDHAGVFQLRSLHDAQRLKAVARKGLRLAVIGGGYIGLETAASMVAIGAACVVIEREQRLLARVASEGLSRYVQGLHERMGTRVLLGTQVEAIRASGERIDGVQLRDGRFIPCDAVLVGIGAQASDELARESGIACDDGVLVDAQGRSSDPAVFAIGDCARRIAASGASLRLESIPSTQEQAKAVAAVLAGGTPPAPAAPWFWSDQFDSRIQIAGLTGPGQQSFTRGDPDQGSFAIYHVDADRRLRAVEAVSCAPEFMAARSLISAGAGIPAGCEQLPLAALRKLAPPTPLQTRTHA